MKMWEKEETYIYDESVNLYIQNSLGFPNSSVVKESACNAGEPSSIPELGRSTGEG